MQDLSVAQHQPLADNVRETLQSLDSAVTDTSLASISGLGIPQIRVLKREIAEIFPASNLPAFLLQGLLQLNDRALDRERVSGDLRVLFRETRRIGLYGTFLAAPALIIFGYQQLLTLAGKDVDSAFPDGTWQFYTEFGLREDSARHTVETLGFAQAAGKLSLEQSASCWVAAAAFTIAHYYDLLELEWRERTAIRCVDLALAAAAEAHSGRLPRKAAARERIIAEMTAELRTQYGLDRLAAEWSARRPYYGPADDPLFGYISARRSAFAAFLQRRLAGIPEAIRNDARARYEAWASRSLTAFQHQMSILATLRPDSFREHREALHPAGLCIALVVGGVYHLIPVYEQDRDGHFVITPRDADPGRPGQSLPLSRDAAGDLYDRYGQPVQIERSGVVRVAGMQVGSLRPAPIGVIRAQVAAALKTVRPLRAGAARDLGVDQLLAAAQRARQEALYELLAPADRNVLEALRRAPIVIGWDDHDQSLPLHQLRRSNRGAGNHALSLLRAGSGVIFDMSHIFFDGLWGAILAEMMTGFAIAQISAVAGRAPATGSPTTLAFRGSPALHRAATAPTVRTPVGIGAESRSVRLAAMNTLRRKLLAREIELTVNDLLLIARYAHAAAYRPGPAVLAALDDLAAGDNHELAAQIVAQLEQRRSTGPVLLIPMDASALDPRERLHPTALRNPCPELAPLLERSEQLLRAVQRSRDQTQQREFEVVRTALCGELLRFGAMMRALREITTRGEGFTTAALRLMAHLPQQMQSLLDRIPQKIDVLNEIVKGGEVFSNIGQVAPSSGLSRFMSSRDDGDTKELIWGIMTDARGEMIVTLRDFRAHVDPLLAQDRFSLAELLAADYLESYTTSVNNLVRRINRVLTAKAIA
ncbi:MAG: hypothetical protein HC822_15475 [Oscillochloris sp.]|nr:hypothetical protein [Oscillochloris sp.]